MASVSIDARLDAATRSTPDVLTRRTTSIFSRRGTLHHHDSEPAMRGLAFVNKVPRHKGTILNAVPQECTRSAAPISPRMALPATMKPSSPLEFACHTASIEAICLKETQTDLLAERRAPKHAKSASQSERIGVWVDGIVHWESVQDVTISRHQRSASEDTHYRLKPSLTVLIPDGKLLTKEQAISALARPETRDGSFRYERRSSDLTRRRGSRQGDLAREKQVKFLALTSPQCRNASRSSSSISSGTQDDLSCYSKHSSNQSSHTSVEATMLKRLQTVRDKMSASGDFSVINPSTAVQEDFSPTTKTYMDKPLPPTPLKQRPTTPTTPKRPQTARGTNIARPALGPKAKTYQGKPVIRTTKSMSRLDRFDMAFMSTSPYMPPQDPKDSPDSPTLSQAELDLTEHLGQMSKRVDSLMAKNKELQVAGLGISMPTLSQREDNRETVLIVMDTPSRAPALPRKSRRRDWQQPSIIESTELKSPARRLSGPNNLLSPIVHDAPPADWWIKHRLSRSASSASLTRLHGYAGFIVRDHKELVVPIDDGLVVVTGPMIVNKHAAHVARAGSQKSAENVLITLLASMTTISDLTSMMRINKGMYKVYRENEQQLVRQVALNESAPACELREWLKPLAKADGTWFDDADSEDDIPIEEPASSYIRVWQKDLETIENLKTIIVKSCQSVIRKETVAAMTDKSHPKAQQVTDAFWRIWTFCTIFGRQKGRDEDLVGQLDWLKGGRLANNLDCGATVSTNFEFDASSIILDAPDHFGRGNGPGLTADQLYDVTEIWTCLATLLQGYLGRVDQARHYGIYNQCNVDPEDIEMQETMLEEWIAFILTLGPTVVLQLAEHASEIAPSGFALAQKNGWTSWSPPVQTTSRVMFLKEPVARLYEERVTAANSRARNAKELKEKESSRRRIAAHGLEIRMRRQDSAFKRVPLVDMSMERPMSIMSTLSGGAALTPRFPPKEMTLPPAVRAAVHPALRAETVISPASAAKLRAEMRSPPLPPAPSPRLLPSAAVKQQLVKETNREALRTFGGVGTGTVELAIQRIMGMGFSEGDAKHALKMTDGGDGLRVDRAVELLVRRRGKQM